MPYEINMYSLGKPEKDCRVLVAGIDRIKRPARFFYLRDAEEACRIIHSLRIDSAFEGTSIVVVSAPAKNAYQPCASTT